MIPRLTKGKRHCKLHCPIAGSFFTKVVSFSLVPLGVAGPVAGVMGAISGPAAPITVPSVFVGLLVVGWLHEVNANA
jgi:hypothetical protein